MRPLTSSSGGASLSSLHPAARRRAVFVVATVLFGLLSAMPDMLAAETATGAVGVDVDTTQGTIRGVVSEKDSHVFLGVPYAQPPVGKLRWRAPRPLSWQGVRETTRFGDQCHNTISGNSFFSQMGNVSEDCLYLNVWVPQAVHTQPGEATADVIVFLHGGGFILGSASNHYVSPDPENLAIHSQSIVVSFNYRLGVLGFLSHRSLPPGSGLAGILDQIGALEWVQRNIGAFGGNPDSVTVLGESAGALSICLLMTMPSARGLFRRVILESPICDFPFMSLTDSMMQGEHLVKAVNCHGFDSDQKVVDCLINTPPNTLIEGLRPRRGILFYEGVLWFPVIDGHLIPRPPIRSMMCVNYYYLPREKTAQLIKNLHRNGQIHPGLEVMLGYNEDEASIFVLLGFPVYVDFRQSIDILESAVGATRAFRLETIYSTNQTAIDTRYVFSRMMSDLWMCSVHRTAFVLSKWIPDGVYLYHFRHRPSHVNWPFSTLGAYHSAEMAYAFGWLREGNFNDAEKVLSTRMIQDWSHFVQAGKPASEEWEPYATDHRAQIEYNITMTGAMAPWPSTVCQFWDDATVDDLIVIPPPHFAEPFVSRFLNEGMFRHMLRLLNRYTIGTVVATSMLLGAWYLARTKPRVLQPSSAGAVVVQQIVTSASTSTAASAATTSSLPPTKTLADLPAMPTSPVTYAASSSSTTWSWQVSEPVGTIAAIRRWLEGVMPFIVALLFIVELWRFLQQAAAVQASSSS